VPTFISEAQRRHAYSWKLAKWQHVRPTALLGGLLEKRNTVVKRNMFQRKGKRGKVTANFGNMGYRKKEMPWLHRLPRLQF
jgi:hypothetical protein